MAHELAHQLDAFAFMYTEGSLKNRPNEGHYNGINLLMNGQKFRSSTMKEGGKHELLTPVVQARIIKYLKY